MTDQEIVKYVMAQHYGYWDVDEQGNKLEYNTKQTSFQAMAAPITFNVVVFQNWKRHLTDALEVVKNWRAE